jgi:hypothetical protein
MLLVTIGPDRSTPDVLPQLSDVGAVVAILLPGHGLARQEIRALLDDCYVIEFLSAPAGPTSLVVEAFAKLSHVLKADPQPVVLINRAASAADMMAMYKTVDAGNISVTPGRQGLPDMIGFGVRIVENPLLPRFFALLDEFGIVEERSMELLQQTFGGLRA